MVRWLLLSLMSAVGLMSFFTGVGGRAQLLPLGLKRSDTKNTCEEEQRAIKDLKEN